MFVFPKKILERSADYLEKGNPRKAISLLAEVKSKINEEKNVHLRKQELLISREGSLNCITGREKSLEKAIEKCQADGKYDEALSLLKKLDDEIRNEILSNAENILSILYPPHDTTIVPRKQEYVGLVIGNRSPVQIKILTVSGRSAQGRVNILRNFNETMAPHSQQDFTFGLDSNLEGTMIVDFWIEFEANTKKMTLSKQFSVNAAWPLEKRVPVGKRVPTVKITEKLHDAKVSKEIKSEIIEFETAEQENPDDDLEIIMDPIDLIRDGSVDSWAQSLKRYFEKTVPVDFSIIKQSYPNFRDMEGYRNLMLSPFRLQIDSPTQWEDWIEKGGISGDELTSRCLALISKLALGGGKVEFEHDNGTGTSNKDHLINALNIVSGNVNLKREIRDRAKSWDIQIKLSKDLKIKYRIDRKTRKDLVSSTLYYIFEIRKINEDDRLSKSKVTRKVRVRSTS